jgi:Flp pilus assembly protein TadG
MTDRRGAVSLEFAIIASLFLAMMFSVMDIGQYYYESTSLREATEVTLRSALIDPTLSGCTAPVARLAGKIPIGSKTGFTMCVTRNTVPGMQSLVVNGSIPYQASVFALIAKSQQLHETEQIQVPN